VEAGAEEVDKVPQGMVEFGDGSSGPGDDRRCPTWGNQW
jgi:hypothetical protein